MSRFDAAQVRRYYDRHTSTFVLVGQGGSALHRAVWAPGVANRSQAFRFVEDRIIEWTQRLQPSSGSSHIVDLGCGVGGSLCYIAERLPIRGTGITLSPVQGRLAEQRIRDAGCADRVRCIVGDYCALPDGVPPADVAFAIESFVHAPAPERFLAQCSQLVRPGGLLVICDDFRRSATTPAAERTIERFCRGWRVNSLLHAGELQALARDAGFAHQETIDLSPHLELHRVRDRLVDGLLGLLGWLPLDDTRFGYLVGGSALQQALSHQWIGYDLALFERR